MRLIPLAVLALCVALIGAGCGGDDEETTTETTTAATGASGASGASGESGGGLLPDDFAAEADAICAEGDKEIDSEAGKYFGGGGEPSEADQEKFVTEVVLPGIQDQIDQLGQLDDPEEGADEWNTFLEDAQEVVDRVEKDPSLITDQFTENAEDPFADVSRQADELGLARCANSGEEEGGGGGGGE